MEFEIPSRNGFGLCSARNPKREAERWLATQAKSVKNGPFLILGLGAGFHLVQFAQAYPDSVVYVFDYEAKLRTQFLEQFSKDPKIAQLKILIGEEISVFLAGFDVNNLEAIFSFRPSWAGSESEFEKLERELLGKPWREQRHSANTKSVSKATEKIFEELLA